MKRRAMLSWKQLLVLCCLLFTFAGLTAFLFGYQRDEKRFTQISSRLFTDEISGNTLNMHYTLAYPANFGIYDYKATLPTYSAEGRLASRAATEELLHTLGELNPQKLSPTDRYTYILLMRSLKSSLELSNYAYYEEPLSPSSGMQTQLPILLAEYTFRTRRDVEDYLALLDQTDDYFFSLLTFEQEKAEAGLLMSAASLDKVKKQCDTILTKEELDAGTHFLQTTFTERLQPLINRGIITEEEALQYQAQNSRLLKTVMLPAYETLADGLFVLEDETIPMSGLASKPEGREYYRRLLMSETGSYRDITEIEQLLMNKFYEEYNAILALTAEHPEVLGRIYDETFVAFPISGADAMLADLQARMSADFPGLPTVSDNINPTASSLPTATVKAVSPSLEDYSAPAFYLTTPIDDSDSNVIYINQSTSPYGLELYTILAHEGYPGHLYQTVYRNRSFLLKEENNARELLWYGGYLEGWGLYTEFYSFDYAADIYSEQGDDSAAVLTQLEQHNRSLQLCLYCLLDIMIHYENASYSQVADVLEGMGIENSSSVRAVYAYLVEEPCNYLKYYVGYLEILQLKEEAKTLWGEEYSDLRFHTFYLDCGPSDFTTLRERLVEEAVDS